MNQNHNRLKFEEKITELLNLAELYLDFALSYRKLFDEFYNGKTAVEQQKILSHPITSNIILHANSYLFLSVGCLHTLLKSNDKTELSFIKYFNKFGKTQVKIEQVRKLYKDSLLDQVRDKIIAHKDLKNIGDPGVLAAILVHKNFFIAAEDIINRLDKTIQEDFYDPHVNNPLLDLCEEGLKNTVNYYRELLNLVI